MSKTATAIAFVAGAAIGSVVTWYISKRNTEQIIQREVDSVKEAFSKQYGNAQKTDSTEEPAEADDEESKAKYAEIIEEQDYETSEDDDEDYEDKDTGYAKSITPYVISPYEFDQIEAYETRSLTYYADQVLTDDDDRIIENIDEVVGIESLTHFGEYEDDSVFVRNDRLKCDYEILFDQRNYSDVIAKYPYKAEVE